MKTSLESCWRATGHKSRKPLDRDDADKLPARDDREFELPHAHNSMPARYSNTLRTQGRHCGVEKAA